MHEIKIRDLYTGKPDAKDEINFEGLEEFIKTFVVADHRWQHKGDERVILANEWRLFVHYALHGALSLGARLNFGLTRGEQPETGDVVNAVVQTVIRSFALVEFTHNGESYLGQIHISEFTKLGYGYIRNLSEIVHIDDEYRTALLDYHEKYERWNLQIIPQELE